MTGTAASAVRLSITSADGQLTLAVARDTLLHKASVPYDEERVAAASRQLVEVLARGARRRTLTAACLADLRTLGEELYRALFPPEIREELAELEGQPILLEMDEAFVGIPWELVYDGESFLCRRYDLGRAVSTDMPRRAGPARTLGRPAKVLVLCSDARGDLPAVAAEGQAILDVFDGHKAISARAMTDVAVADARGMLKEHDIVHFAGHAEYVRAEPSASGWLLADGLLTAGAVAELTGGRPMPLVVFSNACVSSHEQSWRDEDPRRVFGLANAFLLAGVRYYLGTVWDIVDSQARVFARAFYAELSRGRPIGAAVRRAREAVIVSEGEGGLGWASYVLYGDPAFVPFNATDARPVAMTVPTPRELAERDSLKGLVKLLRRVPPRRRAVPLWLAILVVIIVAGGATLLLTR